MVPVACVALLMLLLASSAAAKHSPDLGRLFKAMDNAEALPERVPNLPSRTKRTPQAGPQRNLAVCGADTSQSSTYPNVCKMYLSLSLGDFVCSAWLIAPDVVATAGHCVIDPCAAVGGNRGRDAAAELACTRRLQGQGLSCTRAGTRRAATAATSLARSSCAAACGAPRARSSPRNPTTAMQ